MKSTNKSKKRRANVHRNTPLVALLIVLRLFAFPAPSRIEPVPASYASEVNVVEVPRDYTIQAAVGAAIAGDIRVAAGVCNENLVIGTAGLRLHARSGAVIDGAGLTGSGMLVVGTAARLVADVELSGFEVRDFQREIGVRLASQARIRANEDDQNMKWSGAAVALDRAMVIAISGPPRCLTPSLLDDLPVHNHWERSPRKRSRRRNRADGTSHLRKVVLSMMHVKQRHSRA